LIKIEKNLWDWLQSKGFFSENDKNDYLKSIYDKRMYKTRLQRWYINGLKFPLQDVKNVFKHTKAEDMALLSYYADCISYTKGHINLDKTAIAVADKVTRRLKYKSDQEVYNKDEYWARPIDIHNKQADDCDGFACLSCYVCGLLGIPSFRRFVRVGMAKTKEGTTFGHATFIYLSTKTNEFYPLEGSLYPADTYIQFDITPLKKNDLYWDTWWITNESDSYGTSPLIQIIGR
jgi:hypothetical protein